MQVITKHLEGTPLVTVYVLEVGGVRLVVDPGPASLFEPLEVDAVLCTHLHLDHCGSAGHFGKPVYVHEKYTQHVVDPSKVYEAARALFGAFAEKFGPPRPSDAAVGVVDGARLFDAIDAVYTPGHAPHHVMYYYRDEKALFVGDGAGVHIPELGVVVPTTPPPFKLDLYLQSLDRVRGLDVEKVCFAHYYCTRDVEILGRHREQVKAWVEVLQQNPHMDVEEALRALAKADENVEKVVAAGGLYLDFYLRYSVMGFLDYLRGRG